MLAQISIDEKDLKGAFEKLKKSLQIKTSLYTDTEHPEVQKTIAQLEDLSAKIGFEPPSSLTERRQRHASAGATLHPRSPNLAHTADNISKMSDDGNPFSAIMGVYGGGGQSNPVSLGLPPRDRPTADKMFAGMIGKSTTFSAFEGQTEDVPAVAYGMPVREQGYKPTENLELLRRFIRPDGKIITEEDSDDIDEAINKQMEENDAESKSKDSEDDNEESDGSEDDLDYKTAIHDNAELLEKLSKDQKAQLLKLKDDIFQRGALGNKYNPLPDVVNSNFFNGLSPRSRDQFRLLNMHIFEQS